MNINRVNSVFSVGFGAKKYTETNQAIETVQHNDKEKLALALDALATINKAGIEQIEESKKIDLSSRVEDLDLSVRAEACLKRAGINNVRQLALMSDDDLMKVRNLGIKGYEEIKGILNTAGIEKLLDVKMDS